MYLIHQDTLEGGLLWLSNIWDLIRAVGLDSLKEFYLVYRMGFILVHVLLLWIDTITKATLMKGNMKLGAIVSEQLSWQKHGSTQTAAGVNSRELHPAPMSRGAEREWQRWDLAWAFESSESTPSEMPPLTSPQLLQQGYTSQPSLTVPFPAVSTPYTSLRGSFLFKPLQAFCPFCSLCHTLMCSRILRYLLKGVV